MKLIKLFQIIKARQENMLDDSYTSSLFRSGLDKITQKVGEEAIEVVIAAKNESKARVISEIADLWYHCLVLLVQKGLTIKDIELELEKRHRKG